MDRTTTILSYVLVAIVFMTIGGIIVAELKSRPIVVIRFDTKILDKAMLYQGVEICEYARGDDELEGSFSYKAGEKRRSVFNIPFMANYAKEIMEFRKEKNMVKDKEEKI